MIRSPTSAASLSDDVRTRGAAAFSKALAALGFGADVVRANIEDAAGQLDARMRLALVGRISSGKSTLVNALLGKDIVATGAQELTFTVTWLRYARHPSLTLHFRDGRPPQQRDLAELEWLSTNRDLLSSTDYLEVGLSNDAMLDYDLIDTPGLDSHLRVDQENTLRMMRLTPLELRASTISHAARAHAIVLVFCRALAVSDEDLVAEFQGATFGTATPVTAVGALTKVETMWPQFPDPLAEGYRVARRMMRSAGAGRMLYDLLPVASKVAAGAAVLTKSQFVDLCELSAGDPESLARRVARGPFFATREYSDLAVPAVRRAPLLRQLDRYGVHLACSLIRDEGISDLHTLRQRLLDRSGMTAFRELLTGHFGNRADLIKLRQAIDQVVDLNARLADRLTPAERVAAGRATAELRRLELDEHGFAELRLLRQHYNGELTFDADDTAEMLRVTGEHGTSIRCRLGLAPDASLPTVLARAAERRAYWSAVTVDLGYSGATRRAAQVMLRSYERLTHMALPAPRPTS